MRTMPSTNAGRCRPRHPLRYRHCRPHDPQLRQRPFQAQSQRQCRPPIQVGLWLIGILELVATLLITINGNGARVPPLFVQTLCQPMFAFLGLRHWSMLKHSSCVAHALMHTSPSMRALIWSTRHRSLRLCFSKYGVRCEASRRSFASLVDWPTRSSACHVHQSTNIFSAGQGSRCSGRVPTVSL